MLSGLYPLPAVSSATPLHDNNWNIPVRQICVTLWRIKSYIEVTHGASVGVRQEELARIVMELEILGRIGALMPGGRSTTRFPCGVDQPVEPLRTDGVLRRSKADACSRTWLLRGSAKVSTSITLQGASAVAGLRNRAYRPEASSSITS